MDGFKLYLCGYACYLQYNFAKAFYLKKKNSQSYIRRHSQIYLSTFSILMGYLLDDWKCCCTLLIVMSGKQRHVIIPPETGSDTQCRSFIIKNLLFHVKIVISTKRGFRFVAVDNYRTEFNRGFLTHAHVRLLLQQLFNYKPLLKSCRIP